MTDNRPFLGETWRLTKHPACRVVVVRMDRQHITIEGAHLRNRGARRTWTRFYRQYEPVPDTPTQAENLCFSGTRA